MTALATASWTPPLTPSELSAVLARIRQWIPLHSAALLEDVGSVRDDVVPREEDLDVHARRLRGHPRRMAWSVHGPPERLTVLRCTKEAA